MVLNKIALSYLVIFIIAPPMASANIYRIIALAMMTYLVGNNVSKCRTSYSIQAIGAAILMAIINIACGESIFYHIQFYIFLSFIVIFSFLLNEQNKREYYFLIPLVMITYIIFNVTTIRELASDPHVMRSLSRSTQGNFYSNKGVGGYGYLYSLIMIIPVGISEARYEKGIKRIISLVFLVTSYILVFRSAYMLAMLITIIMTGVYIILAMGNISRSRLAVIFLIMIAALILYNKLDSILLRLADLTRPSMIQKKLEDIYELLYEDASVADTSLWGRYERYFRDFMLVISSPLWGVLRYTAVGKHSAIMDTFAQYGIPIGIYVTTAIFKPLRAHLNYHVPELTVCFIGLGLFLLLNSPVMSVGIVYVVFPLALYKSKDRVYL